MSLSRENDSAVVITDTSCLIILNKLSLLDVLHQLFPVIVITPEIAKEYGHDLPAWISVVSVENKSLLSEFTNIIDLSEASAVALAHEVKTKYLVTGDLKARKLLIKLKMPVVGTLGILIRAKESD